MEGTWHDWHSSAQQTLATQSVEGAAAMLAHEVKNPLGSMKLLASLLKDDTLKYQRVLPPHFLEYLDAILYGIQTIDTVITETLHAGIDHESSRGPLNLHSLLSELAYFVAPRRGGRVPTIECKVNPFIIGHEVPLRQAFLNVLVNAIEACGVEGEVSITITEGEDEAGDPQAIVTFSDSGPKIPDEIAARFFQEEFTTKQMGSGLGLAVVKAVVTRHDGAVRLTHDGGTKCVITLPRSTSRPCVRPVARY